MAAEAGERVDPPMKSKSLVPQKLIDQIAATGAPLVVENISGHPLFTGSAYLHLAPPRIKTSFIAVPIKVDERARRFICALLNCLKQMALFTQRIFEPPKPRTVTH